MWIAVRAPITCFGGLSVVAAVAAIAAIAAAVAAAGFADNNATFGVQIYRLDSIPFGRLSSS